MTDTGAWNAAALDLITKQAVEHIWRVEFPNLTTEHGHDVPAWGISVSLDGSRNPYGTAKFNAPAFYISETTDGAGTIFSKLVPKTLPPVRIWAGWRYVLDGVAVEDLQVLFAGTITARRFNFNEEGRTWVEFEAQTAEAVYDQPNSRPNETNVVDTWTGLVSAMAAISVATTPWYKVPVVVEEAGHMNTPTSTQLDSWRALTMAPDDDVMELLQSWASELGQWVRGDVRNSGTTPTLLVSEDPYPYREYFALPARVFTDVQRADDLDEWANILKLTAAWTDASSGDPKTKKKTYLGDGVAPGATTLAARSKAVTVQMKPNGGTMSDTWPIALKWLRRIQDMSEVFYTATGRAVWWLQPRIHGMQIPDLGLSDAPGPISAVTFQVDQGSMSLSWNTSNDRT